MAEAGAFEVEYPVRFEDCDHAGIVFYPRLILMLNRVVEDWFEALDWPFARMHGERGEGVPIVDLECGFPRPTRLGDRLTFALLPEHLGRSSIRATVTAECREEVRFTARFTLVYVSAAAVEPVEIPARLRSAMARYLPAGA